MIRALRTAVALSTVINLTSRNLSLSDTNTENSITRAARGCVGGGRLSGYGL